MTNTNTPTNLTTPMTLGRPIGPNVQVTVSAEVASVLADDVEITFDGIAPDEGSARGVHWLTQFSRDEVTVAFRRNTQGGGAQVFLIQRNDDQGRTWACVTSSAWTAGLFLSRPDAVEFAVEVAANETPRDGGWDHCLSREEI